MARRKRRAGQPRVAALAASKRAQIVRSAGEFDIAELVRLANAIQTPMSPSDAYGWLLSEIRDARDDQLRGRFRRPAQLAETMRTDDAIFAAWRNRLAPVRNLPRRLVAAKGARAAGVAAEAEALFGQRGVGLTLETIVSINDCLANHGVAFAYIKPNVRQDGTRVDFTIQSWPIRWVRWDPLTRCYMTRTDPVPGAEPGRIAIPMGYGGTMTTSTGSGLEIPIVHGDGLFIIFTLHEHEPWRAEACILSSAMVWARHAFAARDWSKASTSHGNARVVGEMPPGVSLAQAGGTLTDEATAFLVLLRALWTGESPVGIRPAGSKTEFVSNNSTAWQVWSELCLNAERAAARIYLGTDGILGAQGGAPGIDITALFGVASTIVAGDIGAIARGITTGAIQPWAAINFGDSRLAPTLEFEIPDADADAVLAATSKRDEAFHAEVGRLRTNRFVVDNHVVAQIAKRYGVDAPTLATAAPPTLPPAQP